jgi:hypothetical protein
MASQAADGGYGEHITRIGCVHAPRCTVLATVCVPEDEASRRSAWCGRNGCLHRVAWRGGEVEFHPVGQPVAGGRAVGRAPRH